MKVGTAIFRIQTRSSCAFDEFQERNAGEIMPTNRILLTGIVASACLAASAVASAAVVIDDFNNTNRAWPVSLAPTSAFASYTDTGVSGVLGGDRYLSLRYTDYPNPDAGLLAATVAISTTQAGAGILDFATPSDRTGQLNLGYFPPPIALNPLSSISISLVRYDGPASQAMSVAVELNGTSYTPAQTVLPGGPTVLTFDLSSVPPVVLANLQSVDLWFTPPTGGDFRLDEISATLVPEPGAAAMAILSVPLLMRRRRKDAKA